MLTLLAYALLAFLGALQVADWWTSRRIIAAGGHELNPIEIWLMNRIGVNGALILKAVLVLAVGVLALVYLLAGQAAIVLAIACAPYLWAVVHNRGQM